MCGILGYNVSNEWEKCSVHYLCLFCLFVCLFTWDIVTDCHVVPRRGVDMFDLLIIVCGLVALVVWVFYVTEGM